mmetsp:Transcript_24093/g.74903  ORF Transcript_24093/g.74903 Transcript_24093/m.74903 type:complete len:200 (-) Transcript_24093:441-1040(-)
MRLAESHNFSSLSSFSRQATRLAMEQKFSCRSSSFAQLVMCNSCVAFICWISCARLPSKPPSDASTVFTCPATAARRSRRPSTYVASAYFPRSSCCCSAISAMVLSNLEMRSIVECWTCSALFCASRWPVTVSCKPLLMALKSSLKSSRLSDCFPSAAMMPSMVLACLPWAASITSIRPPVELQRSNKPSSCFFCLSHS